MFHLCINKDKRGVVSMANNGADTNGAQFFITYSAQPHLNNKYTIFGQVQFALCIVTMFTQPAGKRKADLLCHVDYSHF